MTDGINLRWLVLLGCLMAGAVVATMFANSIFHWLRPPPRRPTKKVGTISTRSGMHVELHRPKGAPPLDPDKQSFDAMKIEVPVFQCSKLVAYLTADKAERKGQGPIWFTNPVLTRFAEDGKTVINRLRADRGSIQIRETMDLGDMKLVGNVRGWQFQDPFAREKE